jgi:tetratricopeptide (TPR) repeat protein
MRSVIGQAANGSKERHTILAPAKIGPSKVESGAARKIIRQYIHAPDCMTTRFPLLARLMAALALSAAGLLGSAAHADDAYTQVQRLLKQGRIAPALQQADAYIAKHPRDPQMRFIKAEALQAAGRVNDAEAMLTQLTHDYPELAEPWNNLAVLYAARGQIDQAKTALDAALRIDPHYATALENLGDINIRLALRHYTQARQADASASARLSAKIDAARRVIDSGAPAPQAAASQPQPAASQPTAAASEPAGAASGPAAAATQPADAAPRPVAGNLPVDPTAPPPQPAASQPEAAAPEPADTASGPAAAAAQPADATPRPVAGNLPVDPVAPPPQPAASQPEAIDPATQP